MITIEKVIELDEKVNSAVLIIKSLREENRFLTEKITSYKEKIEKLEEYMLSYQKHQHEIEAGIKNAVSALDSTLNQVQTQPNTEANSSTPPPPPTQPIPTITETTSTSESTFEPGKSVVEATPNPSIETSEEIVLSSNDLPHFISPEDIEDEFDDDEDDLGFDIF